MPRGHRDHQWAATPVNELMDLGRQSTSGSTKGMIRGLGPQILVIRLSPLCGRGPCQQDAPHESTSRRVDVHG